MLKTSTIKTLFKRTVPYVWGYAHMCALIKSIFPKAAFNWISRLPVKPGLVIKAKFGSNSIFLSKPERCSIAKKFFWTDGHILPKEDEMAINYFITLSQQSKYILDIGSNSGIFSLIASRSNPNAKVFSYDILPEAFHLLIDNLMINNLMDSVTPFLNGVGKSGVYHAPMNNITSEMPTSLKLDQSYKDHNSIEVEVKTLDNIFSELHINEQACIKIDVEGFEADIFENSKLVLEIHRPFFLCEVLTTTLDYFKYDTLLSNYHYKKFLITDMGLIAYEDISPNIRFKDWIFIPKEKLDNVFDDVA